MKSTNAEFDGPMTFILVLCGFLLVICFLGLILSGAKSVEKTNMLQSNNCKLHSQEATGNRIYCGKACFRYEIRKVYDCNNGRIVITE